MYYPLYNNPFYYPMGAYIPNMCSYNYLSNNFNNVSNTNKNSNNAAERQDRSYFENAENSEPLNDLFSIKDDRLEVFGISINIDDLIILIMLFFLFKDSQIDYSIIIILALILFDQN